MRSLSTICRVNITSPIRCRIVLVLVGLMAFTLPCLVPACPAQEDAKAKEISKLEGEWVQESYVLDGKRIATGKVLVTFQENTVTWHYMLLSPGIQSDIAVKNTFDLDLSGDPKKISFKNTGPPGLPHTRFSSYRLSGDTLEVCYRLGSENEAPKVVESKTGSGLELITLKRVKKNR